LNWQPLNGPLLQLRHPTAGQNREQLLTQPLPGPPQGLQIHKQFTGEGQHHQGEQPLSLHQRQQQEDQLKNRNNPAQNRPSLVQPHLKPNQGLTGLLQRFLGGGGDRRKDLNRPQTDKKSDVPHAIHKGPPPVSINGKADLPFPPNFQGPLPPIIVSKVQAATRPNFDGVRRSERPLKNPSVLDPFSASIIKGGSVLGTAGKPVITDAERAQLERFLFGPSEQYTPRSFTSESLLRYS
jgi:hypothetical protein